VFVARPCPLSLTIYALSLFSVYAVDRIGARVRKNSQEFGRENLISSKIRRNLKGFGKKGLIKSKFYETDERFFAGMG
jgi:hypothetical protein